jgi:adenosylmethionine---8-amino-7-oxononanoate aminotransferase
MSDASKLDPARSARLWRPYTQMLTAPEPLVAARTSGSRIELADGRVLVDGTASWWTACHGYNHPRIRDAVAAQLERMPHVMLGGLVHEPALELSERLAALLPGDLCHTFFAESGSVAVEIAMKMSMQYWINRGEHGRRRFVSFKNAYHGDTFAAMSVCDPDDGMHKLFAGSLAAQLIVDLPRNAEALSAFGRTLAAERGTLAGLIIEPLVQAAGGFKFHDAAALAGIVAAAREHGLIVIFDEIATGFGRTGSMFACDEAGVVPDIVTLSKALTGGTLPLAATVAREHVYAAFLDEDAGKALMHGPTFTGHPLACAAANASLELFATEPRLEQVAAIERALARDLEPCRSLTGVTDVRVKGAIGVVELDRTPDLDALRNLFVARGVWVRPFGNVVYLMPALTIDTADLQTLTDAVQSVVSAWSATL